MPEQIPAGGVEPTAAQIDALWTNPWSPEQVAERLAGISTPWYVAAGWALDLFKGEQTREHGDIEIAVPAGEFAHVRQLFPEFEFDAVGSGHIWAPESVTEQVIAATHQIWVRDPTTGLYILDIFREPHDGPIWICRRDETLRLPYTEIIRKTPTGIPYLRPELVLLFKAKSDRPKDQQDFLTTLPLLTNPQRATLADLLTRIHPGHAWLAELL